MVLPKNACGLVLDRVLHALQRIEGGCRVPTRRQLPTLPIPKLGQQTQDLVVEPDPCYQQAEGGALLMYVGAPIPRRAR